MRTESKLRSLIKSLSWRLTATLTTAGLVYIFTGELVLAATIGGVELILKLAIYYSHERVWDQIKWGRITALPIEDLTEEEE